MYELDNAVSYGMYRFTNERWSLVEVKVIETAVSLNLIPLPASLTTLLHLYNIG
jgi:hypothetical protein